MEQTTSNGNGASPPFQLTRDYRGNAVILAAARLNFGPYEPAATVMADWLGENDFGE